MIAAMSNMIHAQSHAVISRSSNKSHDLDDVRGKDEKENENENGTLNQPSGVIPANCNNDPDRCDMLYDR